MIANEETMGAASEAASRNVAAILNPEQAAALAGKLRQAGQVLVFTNGCFDLLHRGHVDYLQRARVLGDCLFVGLNGDESVRRLKGPGRPLAPQADRAATLAELRSVDVVVIFYEATAEELAARLRPDVYVKGGDWGGEGRTPPEAAVVQRHGGRVVYLPYLAGRSTTDLLARIRRASSENDSS